MLSFLYGPTFTSIHDYWKNNSFDYTEFVGKVISLLFNTLSRFFIAFLPRRKCLLISWLQSQSTVILDPQKIKSVSVITFGDQHILILKLEALKPPCLVSSG